MILPFTLQQLRILKAIAKEKNFTKAAEALYISQPSLSKHIKTLEKNLDVLLIDRKNNKANKISLTEHGKVFLEYSERILALCEESCRALMDLKNGDRGDLTIGASQTVGTYLMPRVIALFSQNYPQLNLKLTATSTKKIVKKIINREIDIGLVGGEIPEKLKKDITVQPFIKDELNLIVPKFHPFTKREKIKKEELYHLNFITLNSSSSIQKCIDNILYQNNIEIKQLKRTTQLPSIEGIKTAVSLGLGAAFIFSSSIKKDIELETIQLLKIENIDISRTLLIISNPDSYKSRAFEFFYKELHFLKNTIEN